MGLKKEHKEKDGITTTYHRILFLQITPNQQNTIVVSSYTDEEARQAELSGTVVDPYCKTITYETEYDEKMSVKEAYKWLKKLDKFSDAADV